MRLLQRGLMSSRPPLVAAFMLTGQALAVCSASSSKKCLDEHLLLQRQHSLTSFRLQALGGGSQRGHLYVERSLVDDEGNSVGEHFQTTLEECKVACDITPACHSFSYGSFSEACHLKDKEVTMDSLAKKSRDWDWHYKTYFPLDASHYVERTLVADEGREIYATHQVTLAECKELCDRALDCHSFAFSATRQSCYLKDLEVTLTDAARIPAYLDFKTYFKLNNATTTTTTTPTTPLTTATATTKAPSQAPTPQPTPVPTPVSALVPTPAPTPGPEFCVKIQTGGSAHNEGTLTVVINGATVESGSHAKNAVLVDQCYSSPPSVTVKNPTNDGWGGYAKGSADGGATWTNLICIDCADSSGPDEKIAVDGNGDASNQGERACLHGAACTLRLVDPHP